MGRFKIESLDREEDAGVCVRATQNRFIVIPAYDEVRRTGGSVCCYQTTPSAGMDLSQRETCVAMFTTMNDDFAEIIREKLEQIMHPEVQTTPARPRLIRDHSLGVDLGLGSELDVPAFPASKEEQTMALRKPKRKTPSQI